MDVLMYSAQHEFSISAVSVLCNQFHILLNTEWLYMRCKIFYVLNVYKRIAFCLCKLTFFLCNVLPDNILELIMWSLGSMWVPIQSMLTNIHNLAKYVNTCGIYK